MADPRVTLPDGTIVMVEIVSFGFIVYLKRGRIVRSLALTSEEAGAMIALLTKHGSEPAKS